MPAFATESLVGLPLWLKFFVGFAASPKCVASVVPSSRAVQHRLSSRPAVQQARSILELGPGLGTTTNALLDGMRADARLTAIEIVPQFVQQLATIDDPRVTVIEGNALDVERLLREHDVPRPDLIVSGIPFSALSCDDGRRLLRQVANLLLPGGVFITYQFRNRARHLADELFGPARRTFMPWNLPPLWLDEWRKCESPLAADQDDRVRAAAG